MIQIRLSKNDFEYDIRSLVKAFFPEESLCVKEIIPTVEEGEEMPKCLWVDYNDDNITITWKEPKKEKKQVSVNTVYEDRKIYKNILKRLLYGLLEDVTGKILPWGTLTGIRPTKLPMEKLEHGASSEEITQFMEKEYLCSSEKSKLCVDIAKKELNLLHSIDYKNGYSIYIGIPFCPSTCLYCSFTSYSITLYEKQVEQYLEALFKEIDYAASCFKKYNHMKLVTIYIGGGTPTTLSADQLHRLLDKVNRSFDFTYVKEFTVEAGRPDSITFDKLKVLKEQGVTRISINPQTMRQKTLDLIGRKHTTTDIEEAYAMAREVGHDNINMDIILGLPGETKEDVAYTLSKINEMNPDSLTVHTLAIKRAAFLNIYKDKYEDLAPTDTKEMLRLSSDYAKENGYEPYYLYRQKNMADNLENIGYARTGKEGIYNILIMEEKQTIIALGAGATSKFVFLEGADGERVENVKNVKSVKDYIERIDEMIQRKRDFIERNFS